MRPPDVLIVVLDCLRWDAPFKEGPIRADMPNLARLESEATTYSNAIAPSHWTVPSHASILTGLEPWEHRTFRGSTLQLPPDVTTYAERFRREGFRTVCLSANPFISPLTGLSRGFEEAAWGQFSDCFRRFQPNSMPVGRTSGLQSRLNMPVGWTDEGIPGPLRDYLRRMSTRFPLPWEIYLQANRMSGGWSRRHQIPAVSEWIERELSQFLSNISPNEPVFAVVNLLDAHEPYFGVLSNGGGPDPDWLWAYSGPLDKSDWREGRYPPTPRDIARITRLYRAASEILDRRLGKVISAFNSGRDPSRVDLVVVGDHGQSLGERGELYHVRGTNFSTLRVPLIVRASDSCRPSRHDSRVSVTQTVRLLAKESMGVATVLRASGKEGGPLFDSAVSEPLIPALVDSPPTSRTSPGRELNKVHVHNTGQSILVFQGDRCLSLEVSSGRLTRNFADAETAGEPTSLEELSPQERMMYHAAEGIRSQMVHLLAQGRSDIEERRLASWGY